MQNIKEIINDIKLIMDAYDSIENYRKNLDKISFRFKTNIKYDVTEDTRHTILGVFKDANNITNKLDTCLEELCSMIPTGVWLQKIPELEIYDVAKLLTVFDVENRAYASQFMSYAGLSNDKSPYNSKVRRYISELGNIFTYTPGFYCEIITNRYNRLIEEVGEENMNDDLFDILLNKAKRYGMKIFLAHLFEQMYREKYHEEPNRRITGEYIKPPVDFIEYLDD